MIETGGRRLIAAPAGNSPGNNHPATVSIIDATSARALELKALLVLPTDAVITPSTQAVMTGDGKFCLIASSFDVPTLFAFEIETGQLVSHLPLIGRPADTVLFESDSRRTLAVS